MAEENEITKNYNSDNFFDRIKSLVKQNTEFTLRDFLAKVGINFESYYTLRKTQNFPRCNEAQKIADGLGVSLDYLVTGNTKDSEGNVYPPEVTELINGLMSLKEDQRDLLLFTISGQIKYFQERNSK
ncbi:MAG: hypothetical protein MJ176_03470 [Treponema sp.]|nr:hypothetical protein [Treponema sp.]